MELIPFLYRPAFTSIASNEVSFYVHSILESCTLVHLASFQVTISCCEIG